MKTLVLGMVFALTGCASISTPSQSALTQLVSATATFTALNHVKESERRSLASEMKTGATTYLGIVQKGQLPDLKALKAVGPSLQRIFDSEASGMKLEEKLAYVTALAQGVLDACDAELAP